VAHDRNRQRGTKWLENKTILFIILGWSWLITVYDYDMIAVNGQGSTERDNDQADMTPDSTDGPLKIQLALEQSPDSPTIFVVKYYAFEFNGLTQQPKNYEIPLGHPFDVNIQPGVLLFIGIGPLTIENTTGTITEKDIHEMSGSVPIVETIEDSATGETTHILGPDGDVTIGDFEWMDVTGNITMMGNQAIITLEDKS
jgi:hypothetical protein